MTRITSFFGLLAILFSLTNRVSAQVVLNEYSAANLSANADNYGKHEDWVELYNTDSVNAVDLSGWQLSDNPDKPDKWSIPPGISLSPKGHLLVWLSGRDEGGGGSIHANFKITQTKGTPEELVLSNAAGILMDSKKVRKTQVNQCVGRKLDGGDDWGVSNAPSPGATNGNSFFYEDFVADPDFNQPAGFYQDSVLVEITCEDSTAVIRYSLDGNLPTLASPVYTGPINIKQTSVLKAIAYPASLDMLPSFLEFSTYFINVDHTLPVVSASGTELLTLANGNQGLRPFGSFELFSLDKERISKVTGELNSHGQDSWVNDQRSIDWVSRDEMGENNAINEPLFPELTDRDEFQRVILRAAGDDN
ncbi:MAG: chitobiase/beta-hexosaminidase C-terminal domain-containing protein, partial [Saprospiraceae bacterium]|nr:chitobiase/beta-hexosaminidase C-terminal domain-containing protein [Saprospiraceae bacterium]